MQFEITDVSVTGKDGLVQATATFQVRAAVDGDIIFSETLSARRRISSPAGWYAEAKAEMLGQLADAKARYEATMGAVVMETGMTSTVDIEADIKSTLEGGLA